MASTNSTTNLQLSQFVGSDTPKWLQDYNGDMAKIDAFAGQKGQASGLASLDSSGKLAQMPTAADVAAVPTTRKINNKVLSSDITLTAADVGARPDTWTPTAAEVGAVASTEKAQPNGVATLDASGNLAQNLSSSKSITANGVTNNGALTQNDIIYVRRLAGLSHYGFISAPEEDSGYNGLILNAKSDEAWGGEVWVAINASTGETTLCPGLNNSIPLGLQTRVWKTGYFGSTISQSDLKLKDNIVPIDNAKAFIMALNPIAYKMKDGDTGRIHMGFGAQEVAQAAKDTDMGDLSLYQAVEVDENGHEQYYTPEAKEENLSWGLNYNELIAPLVAVVQQQEQRIQALENKIKQLTEVSA